MNHSGIKILTAMPSIPGICIIAVCLAVLFGGCSCGDNHGDGQEKSATGDTSSAGDTPSGAEPETVHPGFDISPAALKQLLEPELPEIREAILARPEYFLDLIQKALDLPELFFILVDKNHPLPEDFVPPDLVGLTGYVRTMEHPFTLNRNDLSLTMLIMPDLLEMVDAARADGVELVLSSTYRSWSYQEGLYNRYVANHGREAADRFSARPGHSQHQLGTAIDFGSITREFAETAQGRWIGENGWNYGFSLSYPEGYEEITGYMYEPWHYRSISPVGTLLEREFFGGIQQYFLEFFHSHRDFFAGSRKAE